MGNEAPQKYTFNYQTTPYEGLKALDRCDKNRQRGTALTLHLFSCANVSATVCMCLNTTCYAFVCTTCYAYVYGYSTVCSIATAWTRTAVMSFSLNQFLVKKRENILAGEHNLDQSLFTHPAMPNWYSQMKLNEREKNVKEIEYV